MHFRDAFEHQLRQLPDLRTRFATISWSKGLTGGTRPAARTHAREPGQSVPAVRLDELLSDNESLEACMGGGDAGVERGTSHTLGPGQGAGGDIAEVC
jgi:hypothetical protein